MAESEKSHIKLFSFGHSYGVPKKVDLIYSVRNFPVTNVDNFQQYDGRHKRIQNELLNLTEYEELVKTIPEQLKDFLNEHPTNSVTIAIGCEQGRHRSVAIIERLGELLGMSYNVEINHRDLQRMGNDKTKQNERRKNRDRKYNDYNEND